MKNQLSVLISIVLWTTIVPLLTHAACIGNNYEQIVSEVPTTMPELTVGEVPTQLMAGDSITLTATAEVDTQHGGSPFYYWCVQDGDFESLSSDFTKVKYIAPSIGGITTQFSVQLGDNLGYIQRVIFRLNILSGTEVVNKGDYKASGTIRDKEGNPLSGVTLQIGDKSTITDATGYWEINGLAEGEYTVIASKAGYLPDSKPCVVSDNEKGCQPALKLEPVLDIKVVPEPRIAKQGENVTYSITVTNQGEETATGV
ncbi:MAG TPA: carboxypeptidase regulatory-like domain-containing protein, partial [Thiotrichaceae bacterium]|nr:carboxypeptidase regulatory-like domain-containing protein [Thiotrichaceae bacterium]